MITKLQIDGFKTFKDFEIEFSPFTVIAGTNASGKSNLFDALQLLASITENDLRTAFSLQRGEPSELFTSYENDVHADCMSFGIEVLTNKKIKDNWGKEAELKYTRLRYEIKIKTSKHDSGWDNLYVVHERLETLKHEDDEWVKRYLPKKSLNHWRPKVKAGRRGVPYIETDDKANSIVIRQDDRGGNKKEFPIAAGITQSVLSGVNSVDFKHAFAIKGEMRSWKFLQLDPKALRQPTKQEIGLRDNITSSGENLAAALSRIKLSNEYALKDISRRLNNLLPTLIDINVYNDQANKQFIIKVKSEDGREYSQRVLSEGTLRLLALCVFQFDDQHNGLLCFEEPENGIHPARLKEMSQLLGDLSVDFSDVAIPLRQVIVNTHSPLLVNYVLELELAGKVDVSVWLSQLTTRNVLVDGKRTKMYFSKLLPVESDRLVDNHGKTSINFPDTEKKLVLNQLIQYLNNADFEKTITHLSNG